jgi:hypothetical protein
MRQQRYPLLEALIRINNHYGYGDIVRIYARAHEVVIRRPFMTDTVRRFSRSGQYVTFCGVTRTLNYHIR